MIDDIKNQYLIVMKPKLKHIIQRIGNNQLGEVLDAENSQEIGTHRKRLKSLSQERNRKKLLKIISSPGKAQSIRSEMSDNLIMLEEQLANFKIANSYASRHRIAGEQMRKSLRQKGVPRSKIDLYFTNKKTHPSSQSLISSCQSRKWPVSSPVPTYNPKNMHIIAIGLNPPPRKKKKGISVSLKEMGQYSRLACLGAQ